MWKKLLLSASAVASTALTACVAVPVEEHRGYGYNHDRYYNHSRDRDHDGVPNWRDRAPDDPWRY